MTTRRRPRRARPAGATAMSTPRTRGLERELAAQGGDVGAGDVELDRGDGVARQPADAVDVGAVGGDPGGDRRRRRWPAAGRPRTTTAARPLRARRVVAGAGADRDRHAEPRRDVAATDAQHARPAARRPAAARASGGRGRRPARGRGPRRRRRRCASNRRAGDPGPVVSGDGDQQGLRRARRALGHVGHPLRRRRRRLRLPFVLVPPCDQVAHGRRGRSAGRRRPTVNRRVPTAYRLLGAAATASSGAPGDAGGALDLQRVAARPARTSSSSTACLCAIVSASPKPCQMSACWATMRSVLLLAAAADEDRDVAGRAAG